MGFVQILGFRLRQTALGILICLTLYIIREQEFNYKQNSTIYAVNLLIVKWKSIASNTKNELENVYCLFEKS